MCIIARAHSEHDAVEGAAAYVPLAQVAQVLAPELEKEPASHAVQFSMPPSEHRPPAQLSQTAAREPERLPASQ